LDLASEGKLLLGYDIDTPALTIELDDAIGQRKKRIITAYANVSAGVVTCAALPHQDAAGTHGSAAEDLDAQPLTVRLAAILDRALTLFMCHAADLVVGPLR
jgi:hypothetical protein